MKFLFKWVVSLIALLIVEGILNNCIAQNQEVKIFYDANANYLDIKDSLKAKYYRVINYKNGNIVGPVTTYFINHNPYIIGYYSDNNPSKGHENGQFFYYFENGNLYQKRNYRNGLLDGVSEEYYPSGIKKVSINYSNGKIYGCNYSWDENGKLVSQAFIENGVGSNRTDCDTLNKSIGVYNNLIKDGTFRVFESPEENIKISYTSSLSQITKIYRATNFMRDGKFSKDTVICFEIEGFKCINDKYSFTCSTNTFFQDGREFEKSKTYNGTSSKQLDGYLPIILDYEKQKQPEVPLNKKLIINFLVKDNYSNAILAGYFIL